MSLLIGSLFINYKCTVDHTATSISTGRHTHAPADVIPSEAYVSQSLFSAWNHFPAILLIAFSRSGGISSIGRGTTPLLLKAISLNAKLSTRYFKYSFGYLAIRYSYRASTDDFVAHAFLTLMSKISIVSIIWPRRIRLYSFFMSAIFMKLTISTARQLSFACTACRYSSKFAVIFVRQGKLSICLCRLTRGFGRAGEIISMWAFLDASGEVIADGLASCIAFIVSA